jgi:hypothetical protein
LGLSGGIIVPSHTKLLRHRKEFEIVTLLKIEIEIGLTRTGGPFRADIPSPHKIPQSFEAQEEQEGETRG